ncbi:hypothetical protein F5X68DRAFT_205064 [Plectosphaerella plurivora]|uniref:Secreted protein n=1 Tax=Plectosphaerella plurivora TaxID=936078 RepID=A0A9P8VEG3_9PEZI|nr:hypothetical protein F5X68DRAFT_205064 [Plectosphaerella plurivora]
MMVALLFRHCVCLSVCCFFDSDVGVSGSPWPWRSLCSLISAVDPSVKVSGEDEKRPDSDLLTLGPFSTRPRVGPIRPLRRSSPRLSSTTRFSRSRPSVSFVRSLVLRRPPALVCRASPH